jgi:hypothetical protein
MNDARAQYLQATGANVQAGAAQDTRVQAQKNLQTDYNNSLYNSTMSGLSSAAGRFAGAGTPQTGVTPSLTPGAAGATPATPAAWGVDPNKQQFAGV